MWQRWHLSVLRCGQESLGTYVLSAAGEGRRPDAEPPLSSRRPEAYRGCPGIPARHKAPSPARDLPWWAVCLSVVRTETSALTVIGIPVMSYLGNLSYLQLDLGYILGRVVVAFFMLPRYYDGEMVTAYAYLGKRFGASTQTIAWITFLITRLLADGIRVLAAAIPLKVILDDLGVDLSYFAITVILSVITILYTFIGGITAVVWVDVVQMLLYVAGGIIAILIVASSIGLERLGAAADAGKTQMFVWSGTPPAPTTPSSSPCWAVRCSRWPPTARTSSWSSACWPAAPRPRRRRRSSSPP